MNGQPAPQGSKRHVGGGRMVEMDRAKRLATIGDIVGRQVTSSNELSYTEAARVLEKLSGARA